MNPVVTSLLQTNDAASPSDVAAIQRLLKEALGLLPAVEDEFSALAQRRKALQASIHDYETVLAPIRLLSQDILQYIFLLTLPDDRNPGMSSKESPLLVSQVCSTWRQAALTAPCLWSRLHIPIIRRNKAMLPYGGLNLTHLQAITYLQQRQRADGEEGYLKELDDHPSNSEYNRHVRKVNSVMSNRRQMVEQWLKRAGMTDLSISIVEATATFSTSQSSHTCEFGLCLSLSSKEAAPEWTRHGVDIVKILVKYASRLAVLDLGIPPQRAKPILGLSPAKVPRLRSLRLWHPGYQSVASSRHAIVGSPHIRTLRITIPAPIISGARVQWGNLVHLAVTIHTGSWYRDPKPLREFLSACQNLVVLSVVISKARAASSYQNTVVSISSALHVYSSRADSLYLAKQS
ncbi:hypothetical protein EST38_g8467 [Candolleomyces aberdarensis]|uniref:F-box domain-containing protein n=1 Tax=Candolleomyces aberdarensis TaxID=2316362 RepID=A0A4Q2DCF6_9AGAR|nr:hypothetical protein EST38_g8467 [Candolleomyces aberdarensis]